MGLLWATLILMIGSRDSLTGRQQPYLHEHIANLRLVTIKSANHGTNLDNPRLKEKSSYFLSKAGQLILRGLGADTIAG